MVDWLREALRELGGSAEILEVAKRIWKNHEHDIRADDTLLYEWQYELRWAAQALREQGELLRSEPGRRGIWTLRTGVATSGPSAE